MTDDTAARYDLECQLVYSVLVAGKTARFAREASARLAASLRPDGSSLFEAIRRAHGRGALSGILRQARTGNYHRLERCLPGLALLDPEKCSIDELEAVHGIGPKTARFFILWTRPGARCAALDVHVLRWLRRRGHGAPRSTPSSPEKYAELERVFLQYADEAGISPRELDAVIWETGVKGA